MFWCCEEGPYLTWCQSKWTIFLCVCVIYDFIMVLGLMSAHSRTCYERLDIVVSFTKMFWFSMDEIIVFIATQWFYFLFIHKFSVILCGSRYCRNTLISGFEVLKKRKKANMSVHTPSATSPQQTNKRINNILARLHMIYSFSKIMSRSVFEHCLIHI